MNIFNNKKEDNNKASPIPSDLRKNKRVAILTDDGVQDLEFFYPYYRFNEAGYDVDVITPEGTSFEGKYGLGLSETKGIDESISNNYDLIYIPGGKAPEQLRHDEKVLEFVKSFVATGKPVAAICHGPQVLISADVVKGKNLAAWPGIKEELEEAGATYVDEALQIDGQFITARKPGDLPRHLYGALKYLEGK